MISSHTDPRDLIRPGRKIRGMSAILLPFQRNGEIDWSSFARHVERTIDADLTPAINMDTGYANLIEPVVAEKALELTQEIVGSKDYVAGAFVADNPGSSFDFPAYCKRLEQIQRLGGTPIIFQSYGLAHQNDETIVESYRQIGNQCERFLAFELGTMFAPFGTIYSLEVYQQLMEIPQCVGAKHSSLDRELEWQRLRLRNKRRPDFRVLTGNDLAIDMVMYGSDYLLGLSTFCPDLFAKRDQLWEQSDTKFYQLNDVLQYLGFFAFRNPTAAYKHTAAMFLHQRGWISTDLTHPVSPNRPPSDRAILKEIGQQLGLDMES